ncbi:MAG: putative domain family protein [Candidatus Saccharibacteria bacterium]|nr:putative domain family protein [Candidatus Saccharibacteria bacterium]
MDPEQTNTPPEITPVQTAPDVPLHKVEVVKPDKKMPRQRHFLAVFFISFMWGTFGADRMYMGYWATGILKLLTFGGFGLWAMTDFIIIMTGTFKDKQGREMLQAAEYKKFAARTVLVFAFALGAFVLLNGIALILSLTQLITSVQDGSFQGIDINQLQSGSGFTPEQSQQLGL